MWRARAIGGGCRMVGHTPQKFRIRSWIFINLRKVVAPALLVLFLLLLLLLLLLCMKNSLDFCINYGQDPKKNRTGPKVVPQTFRQPLFWARLTDKIAQFYHSPSDWLQAKNLAQIFDVSSQKVSTSNSTTNICSYPAMWPEIWPTFVQDINLN